jgi:hypothetical protein
LTFRRFVGTTFSSGQHRFTPHAVVREAQQSVRLYTPHYGRIEMRSRATDDPYSMVALWMIGYEDEPERSAEICICEIFGRDVAAGQGLVPLFFTRHRSILLAAHSHFSNRSTPCMMPRGGVRHIGWRHWRIGCSSKRPGAPLLSLLTS